MMCYLVCLGDSVSKAPLVLNFNLLLHQLAAHWVAGKQPELRRERETGQKKVSILVRCPISGVELRVRTVLGERKGVLIREVSSFQ